MPAIWHHPYHSYDWVKRTMTSGGRQPPEGMLRGLTPPLATVLGAFGGLIRKGLIHRRRGQLDKELRQALLQRVHEPVPLLGRGGARVAQAGVGADQVPG